MKRIFIVGSAGIPAAYGGFETLAENLVAYRQQQGVLVDLTVVCSGRASSVRTPTLRGAKLSYVPLPANGMASIAYDAWSLALAVWKRADVILLLGVSGAVVLPLVRCLGRTRVSGGGPNGDGWHGIFCASPSGWPCVVRTPWWQTIKAWRNTWRTIMESPAA